MADASGLRAEKAKSLRDEAHGLLTETGLFALLQTNFGDPSVTGSAGYDLMVRRDINIHMAVEADRWRDWMAFGFHLAELFAGANMPLNTARYRNDWIEPDGTDAGLNWSLEFKDSRKNPWTVDIWGWDPFDYAVRQARDFTLRTDLATCERDLILRLKTEARLRPHYYGTIVTSMDIYRFCIDKAGDSLGALEAWKRKS